MMRSLFSGVSGLKAHQTRMDVIGNNIANVNTTGFKSSRTTFADTLLQTQSGAAAPNGNLGGVNPKQIGLGTGVASIDTIFTDGSVQSTGKNTDLCLSGNGLFVVKNGNQTYYTRDGAFEFDSAGNYVLPGSGLYVQGWTATDGNLNTSGAVGNITIPAGKSMAAAATTKATYTNNLNAATATTKGISATMGTYGDVLTVSPTYTDSLSIGNTYSSNIRSMDVKFSNGLSLSGANGQYAIGSTYPVTADINITLANGDAIVVPKTSTIAYRAGSSLSSSLSVTSFKGGTTVNLSDGSVLTNNSKTTYTAMIGSDTIAIPATSTLDYTVGNALPGLTITSMTGKTVNLSDGSVLTNNRGAAYTATMSNGDSIAISSSSTTNYATGGTVSLTIQSVTSTGTTNTYTLSDGSTLTSTTTYNAGDTYNVATVNSITGLPTGSIGSITGLPSSKLNEFTVSILSGDGVTTDDVTIASGYSITPANGLKVSGLTLNNVDENTVEIATANTTAYQAGSTYSDTIKSMTLTMSDDTTVTETSGTYAMGWSLPQTTNLTVYDALGNAHSVPVYFTKTSTDSVDGNQWTVSISSDGTGTSTITEDDGSTTTVEMPDATLHFTTDGKFKSGTGTTTMTLTNGASTPLTFTIDLTALTQYAGSSTINGTTDGNAAGTLSSVAIDSSGIITGTYTNGIKQTEAQVAIAQFTNASGLTKTGSSLYQESNNSGTANVKTAGDLGVTITPSALEMSNVDISDEFSNMIITQRGFQSNSKIITVGDEMLETLINMKR